MPLVDEGRDDDGEGDDDGEMSMSSIGPCPVSGKEGGKKKSASLHS